MPPPGNPKSIPCVKTVPGTRRQTEQQELKAEGEAASGRQWLRPFC